MACLITTESLASSSASRTTSDQDITHVIITHLWAVSLLLVSFRLPGHSDFAFNWPWLVVLDTFLLRSDCWCDMNLSGLTRGSHFKTLAVFVSIYFAFNFSASDVSLSSLCILPASSCLLPTSSVCLAPFFGTVAGRLYQNSNLSGAKVTFCHLL